MMYPKSHYRAHIGNVTLYRQNGTGKVVWLKSRRYNEEHIADCLNEAYALGREEALREVDNKLKEIKK